MSLLWIIPAALVMAFVAAMLRLSALARKAKDGDEE